MRARNIDLTWQEAYREACRILEQSGIRDAETDSWILLEYAGNISRSWYLAERGSAMAEETEKQYFDLVSKRAERIPVQHLTGEQEFMGISFYVGPQVLIPRQDTETLVEEAEKLLKPGMKVLDLCTGSGCIAVSLALRTPGLQMWASDLSEEALKIAKRNCERHRADVKLVKSDLFENLEGKFDLIVSNPPYIPTQQILSLQEEVRLYDPITALDGREDGLFFYREIAGTAPEYLQDGGRLLVEIGHDQSREVEALLIENGFTQVYTQKDLAGLDRVVGGVYNKQ